jgi:membrane associated rhomboid family serine protease
MLPIRDNIPTAKTPYVTYTLIAANVLVYFLWQRGGLTLGDPSSQHYMQQLIDWAAIPYEFTHLGDNCGLTANGAVACEGQSGVTGAAPDQPPTFVTAFTAMFMHGGLLHLGGNMLFLWIFGNNVEDAMGPVKFVLFYLLAGIAALVLQIVFDPSSDVPTLGASGAIAGVLGGYLLLFPKARVVTVIFIVFFFTLLELPALIVLGLWFLQQAVFAAMDIGGSGGGVAYFAHVGGFVFGLATIRLFVSRKRVDEQLDRAGF